MKKKHFKLTALAFLLAGLSLLTTVGTATYVNAAECDGVQTSIIDCSDRPNEDTNGDGTINNKDVGSTGVWKLLLTVINWLTIGVGIAVVGGIVFGAIRYISSDGNPSQAQQGMSIITNAVIGLVLYLFMYALLNFLVPGGLFN